MTERDHAWVERFGLTCCQRCGIVKRRTGANNPCPGPVRIGLRNRLGGDRFGPADQELGQALKDQDTHHE